MPSELADHDLQEGQNRLPRRQAAIDAQQRLHEQMAPVDEKDEEEELIMDAIPVDATLYAEYKELRGYCHKLATDSNDGGKAVGTGRAQALLRRLIDACKSGG